MILRCQTNDVAQNPASPLRRADGHVPPDAAASTWKRLSWPSSPPRRTAINRGGPGRGHAAVGAPRPAMMTLRPTPLGRRHSSSCAGRSRARCRASTDTPRRQFSAAWRMVAQSDGAHDQPTDGLAAVVWAVDLAICSQAMIGNQRLSSLNWSLRASLRFSGAAAELVEGGFRAAIDHQSRSRCSSSRPPC